jgi:sulfite reductase beta subunit-like hemoprotein
MTDDKKPEPGSSENEFIKDASNYLRGTIAQGLRDNLTGGISESDQQLVKFHGMYQQDDRDVRLERQRQRLEPRPEAWARVVNRAIPAPRRSDAPVPGLPSARASATA